VRARCLLRGSALSLALAGCAPVVQGDAPGETGEADDGDTSDTDIDTDVEPDGSCGMSDDLTTPFWMEGDRVSFTLSCATGRTPAEAGVEIVNLPSGAEFDRGTGQLEWSTGPTDGGTIDLMFTGLPLEDGQPIESHVVQLSIADNGDIGGAVAPDPSTYFEEWGLPVVHIQVASSMSEYEQDATITIRGETVQGAAKIRGAFSAGYTKPSYTLDFDSAELGVDEWKGGTREHLILITTFDDNSYVRQKLLYDLWAEMADHQDVHRFRPRTFFNIVYINGVYQGVYTGCDRIDDEFIRHMGMESGEGNLYKAVSHDANFKVETASGGVKTNLHAGYEKSEGEPPGDFSDLDALVSHIGNADYGTIVRGSGDLIDIEEFMDWYILVAYTLAEDSAGKNSYLYNGADSGRFRYIPWDFNHSFGQDWRTLRTDAEKVNEYRWNNQVFVALQDDPAAAALLWARMAALRDDGPLNPDWLHEQMDDYYSLIRPAAERDWAHWRSSYRSFGGWSGYRDSAGDWNEFTGEEAYLRQWISERDAMYGALLP
jgi:spore coat protein H